MFDMVEIRDRDGHKFDLPLESNKIPHEDFGESYGVISICHEPYLLVAQQTDNQREADIEGRTWSLVHPKSVRLPNEFFERENASAIIDMVAPFVSEDKLDRIKAILEGENAN